jgi:AcrR family transcriptional regulator
MIREQALALIVKSGLDGFSMQKLADAADVSPATIYIYFRDREDLIVSVYQAEAAKMAEATLAGFDPGMSFADGLKVQWINRARYFLANPTAMSFLEQMRHSPLHARADKSPSGGFVDVMRAFVTNAIARGELARMPVEVYWAIAFAPLYQLVKFHIQGHGLSGSGVFAFDEEILNQTLALVLKALKP